LRQFALTEYAQRDHHEYVHQDGPQDLLEHRRAEYKDIVPHFGR
jgi:hypothetical protein